MTALLAHAGPGASWQALVTVLAVLAAGLFLLAAARVVRIESPNDLVLPLAGIVIVASLGTSASATFSDQIGWALPVGVIALVALFLAANRPAAWTLRSPTTAGAVVLAVVAGIALQAPLTRSLHPAPVFFDLNALPSVVDVAVAITSPASGATVGSPVRVVVDVSGGSVANDGTEVGTDPEEGGRIRVLDGASILDVTPNEVCSSASPCTTLTYDLDLTPGQHQILVEFLSADGSTFRPSVYGVVVVTVQ